MIDKPKIDKAMILAAGKGTRMRAAPDDPPKPLTEIAGQSLLARMMDRMRDTGIRHIVVNLHHKADWLETMLADYARAHDEVTLSLSDERDVLLETGGGVKKALPLLGDGPFLVANADLLWQENRPALDDLRAAFDPQHMQALLLLADRDTATGYDGTGDYHLVEGARLKRKTDEAAPYIFAGVQILTPALFADTPDGPFSLNLIYDRAQAAKALYGHRLDGQWMHVGTPEGRAEAERLMQK